MPVKQSSVLGRVPELVPGEHATHTGLELDDKPDLLAVHLVGDVLDVFEVLSELARCFLLYRLVRATTCQTHFYLFEINLLFLISD